MSNYRRACVPGGTFFLTLVTYRRHPLFESPQARTLLRESLEATRDERPFELDAIVLLPDHLHLLITLPDGDSDFSTRVGAIKGRFTRTWLTSGGSELPQAVSREQQEYRGIWQKRFWEHCVRDADELHRCMDYIHYNPVKHGLAACPHAWEWSSFQRHVALNHYAADWLCACGDAIPPQFIPPDVSGGEMD